MDKTQSDFKVGDLVIYENKDYIIETIQFVDWSFYRQCKLKEVGTDTYIMPIGEDELKRKRGNNMKKITLDNLEIEISEESFNKLKEQFVKEEPNGWFVPKNGEKYYYVEEIGEVDDFFNTNYKFDQQMIKTRNCYETQEEAERATEIEKLIAETRWYPTRKELEDENIYKVNIRINVDIKELSVDVWCIKTPQTIIYKTIQDAQKIIDAVSYKEYLKYVLKVV